MQGSSICCCEGKGESVQGESQIGAQFTGYWMWKEEIYLYFILLYIFFTGSEWKSRGNHGGCHYIKSGCQEKLKKYVYFWYLGGVDKQ